MTTADGAAAGAPGAASPASASAEPVATAAETAAGSCATPCGDAEIDATSQPRAAAEADRLIGAIVEAIRAGEHRHIEALIRALDAVDPGRAAVVLARLHPDRPVVDRGDVSRTKDFKATCRWGHRTFLRLELLSDPDTVMGRCDTCGEPARLAPVIYSEPVDPRRPAGSVAAAKERGPDEVSPPVMLLRLADAPLSQRAVHFVPASPVVPQAGDDVEALCGRSLRFGACEQVRPGEGMPCEMCFGAQLQRIERAEVGP